MNTLMMLMTKKDREAARVRPDRGEGRRETNVSEIRFPVSLCLSGFVNWWWKSPHFTYVQNTHAQSMTELALLWPTVLTKCSLHQVNSISQGQGVDHNKSQRYTKWNSLQEWAHVREDGANKILTQRTAYLNVEKELNNTSDTKESKTITTDLRIEFCNWFPIGAPKLL